MATKLALISYLCSDHFFWLQQHGGAAGGLVATLSVIGFLSFVTWALRRRYYLHLHHWFCGLVLSPLAVCDPPWWSGVLLGVALGQFVEGASRWSCAPIWHTHALKEASRNSAKTRVELSSAGIHNLRQEQ